MVISGGFYKNNISIDNYYSSFTADDKTILSNIFSNIKNKNILDKYQDNIIIDPANIGTLSREKGLQGQSGLSSEIYKKLDYTDITYKDFQNVHKKYATNHKILYDKENVDAFYGEYKIKADTNNKMYIIHTVGPSFRDNINNVTSYDDYIQYLSYTTFNKIYKDILYIYNVNNTDNKKKLLLVPISSGEFATYTYNNTETNITNEILTITAAIFINLYLQDQKVYMYIYNKKGNKRNYTYFIEQINTIIGFIK